VDAWFDKAKPCGERSRTILPGQNWELEIRKAVREASFRKIQPLTTIAHRWIAKFNMAENIFTIKSRHE
jgi:hypothetical protein